MSLAQPYPLRFTIGPRTLLSVRRRLVRVPLSLAHALAGDAPALPPLDDGHGYLITSLPAAAEATLDVGAVRKLVRQRYARRYADLSQGFDGYLAGFSGKSRSTLLRKERRFAELSGGRIDIRTYRTAAEIASFHGLAREVSRKTYQEKLLDAGLPDDPAEMIRLAATDRARGWLLFLDGVPVSYLYAPAVGDTLIYAYLGYDPAVASHSPGTVLQLAAMRDVIAEARFGRFDFTEGDGQHKRLFATGSVACVDLLLLKPTLANRALEAALIGFDHMVAYAKRMRGRGARS